jgi:RNA polymerase sigma factor (sigma-70 family)
LTVAKGPPERNDLQHALNSGQRQERRRQTLKPFQAIAPFVQSYLRFRQTAGAGTNPARTGYTSIAAYAEERALDDETLIRLAKNGALDAYEELVRRYQGVAFRAAYLITREAGAAEDAAQEAFLRAYRGLAGFRPGHAFKPWMLKIVVNEARRRKAAVDRQAHLGRLVVEPARNPSVESQVLRHEMRAGLTEAVRRLPETDQLIITYRYALDLSEAEIAEVMNCPRGTVKSRLSRALGRLRALLSTPELDFLRTGMSYE